jgi:hypothetical protein
MSQLTPVTPELQEAYAASLEKDLGPLGLNVKMFLAGMVPEDVVRQFVTDEQLSAAVVRALGVSWAAVNVPV